MKELFIIIGCIVLLAIWAHHLYHKDDNDDWLNFG